ncbi:unnamed protein product [Heterotrigona itama]|uniref:Uncharacterized protein n=1 Tax=Heterotrigona itama TaxID=395501 RepID=A0A6V7GXE6_9HYME|nr:unnamed protein product [Heterotrigona itama]
MWQLRETFRFRQLRFSLCITALCTWQGQFCEIDYCLIDFGVFECIVKRKRSFRISISPRAHPCPGRVEVPCGRLNFEAHFKRLASKMQTASATLERFLPNIGQPSEKVRHLYHGYAKINGTVRGADLGKQHRDGRRQNPPPGATPDDHKNNPCLINTFPRAGRDRFRILPLVRIRQSSAVVTTKMATAQKREQTQRWAQETWNWDL